MVYRELHEEMGHLGVERVLDLARQRFFWRNMRKDIEHFIHHVCQCLKQKQSNRHTVAPLQPIVEFLMILYNDLASRKNPSRHWRGV